MAGIDTPMVFENLRDSLIALLVANQTGRFVTIGYQRQSTDAMQVKDLLRTVQVFYLSGDYPKNKSAYGFPNHSVTFQIEYSASKASLADKAVFEDPDATPSDRQIAQIATLEADDLVNKSIDELRRMVTQILMDPVNEDIGLAVGVVSDPWLSNFRKTEIFDKGTLVMIKASETFTANVDETLTGATATLAIQPAVDVTTDQRPIDDGAGTAPSVGMETTQ